MPFGKSPDKSAPRRASSADVGTPSGEAQRPTGETWATLEADGILWEGEVAIVGGGIELPARLILTSSQLVLVSSGQIVLDVPRTWLRPAAEEMGHDGLRVAMTPEGREAGSDETDHLPIRVRSGRAATRQLATTLAGTASSVPSNGNMEARTQPANDAPAWGGRIGAATPMALPPLPDFDDDLPARQPWPPVEQQGVPAPGTRSRQMAAHPVALTTPPLAAGNAQAAAPPADPTRGATAGRRPRQQAQTTTVAANDANPVVTFEHHQFNRGLVWGLRALILLVLVSTGLYFGRDRLYEQIDLTLPSNVEERLGLRRDVGDISRIPAASDQTGVNPEGAAPTITPTSASPNGGIQSVTSDGTSGGDFQPVQETSTAVPDDERNQGPVANEIATSADAPPVSGPDADGAGDAVNQAQEDDLPEPTEPATEAPPPPTSTESPTEVPTDVPTETPLPTATDAPTVAPTRTPVPTATATPTEVPTQTPTSPATATATQTPAPTATVTPTDVPTQTPAPSATTTPTEAPTQTPVSTATVTPTEAPTQTPAPTATATPTPALTATTTATHTPASTATMTPTGEPTQTPTPTATTTPTGEPTQTPTPTATTSPTEASTQTPTPTATTSPTEASTQTPASAATTTPTGEPTQTPTLTPTVVPDATLELQPPSVDPETPPAQSLGDGAFRYSIEGAARGDTIAELPDVSDVGNYGEWVVISLYGENWTEDPREFDMRQFRLFADGKEILLDVGNAWVNSQLGLEPAYGNTATVSWAPGEGHRFALTFLVPQGAQSLVLYAGEQVVDLEPVLDQPTALTVPEEAPAPPAYIEATVVGTENGETIVIEQDGVRQTVRYLGVDAPTGDDCYAREATAANADLVMGKRVRIERQATATDARGNWVRDVWVEADDGRFILASATLVTDGALRAAISEPNTRFAGWLTGSESVARAEGRGQWSACEPEARRVSGSFVAAAGTPARPSAFRSFPR